MDYFVTITNFNYNFQTTTKVNFFSDNLYYCDIVQNPCRQKLRVGRYQLNNIKLCI